MKTKISLFATVILALLFIGCSDMNEADNNKLRVDITLSRGQQEIVDSQARFAFEFFKQTSDFVGNENMVISPLSLSIDLAMLANGAGEDTYNDIAAALKLHDTAPEELNTLYKMLVEELVKADNRVDLSISNGMWNNIKFEIKDEFASNILNYYGASVQSLDFYDESNAKNVINSWVSEKTKGKIAEIFENSDSLKNTKAILCNAVYFDGKWADVFDKNFTKEMPFCNIDNLKYNIETMCSETTDFMHGSTDEFDVVRLPYGNKAFSMYVIMPTLKEDNINTGSHYDEFIADLDYDSWVSIKDGMSMTKLCVTMPKFRIETKCEKIGMTPFIKELFPVVVSPNMSRMTEQYRDISSIFLDQYNVLEVSENGTIAASVTKGEFVDTSSGSVKSLSINRPFIFLIEEQSTGAILFIGKVVKLK